MICTDVPKVYEYESKSALKDAFADCVKHHTADKIVTYKQVEGEDLKLCYYFPKDYDSSKKYPVFAIIHGGGWASRNIMKDQTEWSGDYLGYLLRYYSNRGFLGVMMTYRLIDRQGQRDDRQLIHLYSDCQDAMNYVADHAEEYGADLSNVTLLGESAGGHLAAAMATNSFFENRLPLKRAMLINPITNLLNDRWGEGCLEQSEHPMLKGMCKQEIQMLYSPLLQITPNNCDILLVHGDADPVVDVKHSILFNRRMTQMGRKSELHILKGATHAFLLREYYDLDVSHTVIAVEIIDKYIKENYTSK